MTQHAHAAASIISQAMPHCIPKIGIILGSGLSNLANYLVKGRSFLYDELPGFPICHVAGHEGKLWLGWLEEIPIVCLQGRTHFYEGSPSDSIATYVRTLKLLGCHSLIITGAAGSLQQSFPPGHLVIIKDHINFQGHNPLIGLNDFEFGSNFVDMTMAYDIALRKAFLASAKELGMLLEEAIYFGVLGPSFETPAEIHAFKTLGANVVGMSVVPEVIIARQCGLAVASICVVTNLAAGLSPIPLSHEKTLSIGEASTKDVTQLIRYFLKSEVK